MGKAKIRVIRDLVIILFSILLAILLARTGTIEYLLTFFNGSYTLTSFVAGVLFTSVFTTAIATAVFLVIGMDGYNPFIIAALGGLGALLGDLIIFRFVKNELVKDIESLFKKKTRNRLQKAAKNKIIGGTLAVLGGIILASPFPDELGVMLLAISGVRTSHFFIFSYVFNSLGILAMVLVGEHL